MVKTDFYDKVFQEIANQAKRIGTRYYFEEMSFLTRGPIVEMFINENMELLDEEM